ncbi:hypothetical protein [Chryseobacterium sp.]|uniref:hypothetical protein n=1 Tax=Chryseobacterium sp. TaxID=1871047 RepID=UPI0025BBDCE9|nr:hypothetical protein [Chryseobacterium sp.]MBV8328336.1 hypothetical protein [Chryseobacterium sp.]
MTTSVAIILGLLISFTIIYIILNLEKFKPKKKSEHQELIDQIHSRIAKANGASIEQFSLENKASEDQQKKENYQNQEFVNKNCTRIEDFIINDELNSYDLRKLADLNGIQLQISAGWYPLVIDLIRELNDHGWDRKVSCIKEKYAELKFYTHHEYASEIYTIIEKYGAKSEHICETCGERGEIRYHTDWDYVACRKHYLENRGKITPEGEGFQHNGKKYLWKEIRHAVLEDLDYSQKYRFVILEFRHNTISHAGWSDNKLYISKNLIGFGNFLSSLPETLPNPDRNYIQQFENPKFCECCGYKAVYQDKCECCENETWKSNLKKRKEKDTEERKLDFIKYQQISWTIDEGEIYEKTQNNYQKNPDYRILFTPEELKEYEEA